MTSAYIRALLAGLLATTAALGACAPGGAVDGDDEGASSEESFLKNAEKTGSKSQKWIYEGWVPALEQTSMFVSLKGHTARVSGLLPKGFDGELPFYVKTSPAAEGRTLATIVYPVATGAVDPATGQAPAGPGSYSYLTAVPYTSTNDKADWGGFPFMKYHQSRGLAFHGPISSKRNAETGDWEWVLLRGPVSHGCNRMAGEHVVELAHVLGLDMSEPHAVGEVKKLQTPVVVSHEWDVFEGKNVDVFYPALASVQRPKTNVAMFRTWDSRNLPQVVCSFDESLPLDGQHCANRGLVKQDLSTGDLLEAPETAKLPWIGTECSSDADCAFEADGEKGSCQLSGATGFCTVSCEGYCEDLAGHAGTFCAKTLEGDGTCMAKAALENEGCATIDGTSPETRERFIGSSGAAAKVATVCAQ
ncbi:MAG: hypothetical protein IPM79_02550 [Polyangiaceae bacterium]|nr:hypothetical protein [Polyangiaceae bacterium]MBK8936545.1 hypothetical protein [Polyangiaceae bacterium]